jgi:hypothetical protein
MRIPFSGGVRWGDESDRSRHSVHGERSHGPGDPCSLAHGFPARREQMDRNSQAIDNGTADARVLEALKLGAEPGAYIERRVQLGP